MAVQSDGAVRAFWRRFARGVFPGAYLHERVHAAVAVHYARSDADVSARDVPWWMEPGYQVEFSWSDEAAARHVVATFLAPLAVGILFLGPVLDALGVLLPHGFLGLIGGLWLAMNYLVFTLASLADVIGALQAVLFYVFGD